MGVHNQSASWKENAGCAYLISGYNHEIGRVLPREILILHQYAQHTTDMISILHLSFLKNILITNGPKM